jgi:hypothetical protein
LRMAAPCPAGLNTGGRKSPKVVLGVTLAGGKGPLHKDFQGGFTRTSSGLMFPIFNMVVAKSEAPSIDPWWSLPARRPPPRRRR